MSDVQIKEVTSHKHLGIHLSDDYTWHIYTESINEKAWDGLNVMCRLKFVMDRKSLEIIYTSLLDMETHSWISAHYIYMISGNKTKIKTMQ